MLIPVIFIPFFFFFSYKTTFLDWVASGSINLTGTQTLLFILGDTIVMLMHRFKPDSLSGHQKVAYLVRYCSLVTSDKNFFEFINI